MSAGVVSMRAGRRRTPGRSPDPSEPCADYSRFSTNLQRDASIPDQQRNCQEKAATNGHTIKSELEFYDEAVSGTKRERTGLNAMLAAAEAGKFKVLYLYSLSRLARESVISLPLLKHLVYNLGVRVISVTEGIDSDDTAWELIAHIMSIVHEQYVRDLADNVFRGQEGTVLANLCVGDYCFGFTSVAIPGSEQGRRGRNAKPRMMYMINPETVAWVVRIFHWFVRERRTLRWIARELNRLAAPKDHRATTPNWRHQYLARLLRNRKYQGWWPWGKMTNVRDPLTGKIRQEERTPEEAEKWLRHLPHLQVIDDAMFEQAQQLLAKNDEAAAARGPRGRLNGSRRGSAAKHPRHLLSGLVQCGHCGSTMHVGGAKGKYLFCPNYHAGTCNCQTQLRRSRAERMILDEIGRRILANPAWQEAVLAATREAWNRHEAHLPAELAAAKKALADVEQKISRLMDRIEDGQGGPELDQRLAQRRTEKRKLTDDVTRLERADANRKPQPTASWIQQQLRHLGDVLSGNNPAAAHALRDLVGGKVVVTEIRETGRQRYHLQGRFTVEIAATVGLLLGQGADATPQPPPTAAVIEEVVLDFREVLPSQAESEAAWALYQQGLLMSEIGRRLGRKKSYVTKLIRQACTAYGVEFVDGRKRRASLVQKHATPAMYQSILPEVMQRYAEGQLICEIADALGCDKATVKKALDEGHAARGEQSPDGRRRRKGLARKSRQPPAAPAGGPEGGAPT